MVQSEADEYREVFKQEEIEPQNDRPRTELTDEQRVARASRILEMAKAWKPSDKTDEVRAEHASSSGGFELYD